MYHRATETVQARHQAGPPAAGGGGVRGCPQGDLHQVKNQP